ncbi:hypothetical protein BT93_E0774 [Corymbia citriodora subsp. variegata]|nr:hypothetical protein BT93_E0774 [Corymbia citriodora subsp. variegata]KAF8027959.1 hypothetical protein BT93_E0774 [Corymbia citriodora subsp. variegata]
MAFEDERFDRSGPSGLTRIVWKNTHHRRSVVACLVQAAYVLEQDRQGKRGGSEALAPPWWKTFGFQLKRKLVDKADSSIFGAIFEYKPPPFSGNHSADRPRFVVTFQGTLIEGESLARDIELDVQFIRNELHSSSRCKTAMLTVEILVATVGKSKVWLAGHSLGSAIALLAGKNMAKKGLRLESFLFNPPYVSAPIERIENEKWKWAIQVGISLVSAVGALIKKSPERLNQSAHSFAALSHWVPQLFVNAADDVCSGYISHFERQVRMEMIGLRAIQRTASQHSVMSLFLSENGGTQAEPLHLIPSANLSINSDPSLGFVKAHGIQQWWKQDLKLKSKVYKYNN